MFESKRWLKRWAFGVAFFLCAVCAWQAAAQTLVEGMTATGVRKKVLVDATGALVLSATTSGLVGVKGVNGTSIATSANPFPVRPSADGTNPVDATHPLPVSRNGSVLGENNRVPTLAGVCYPDINPTATNYAACTGADQSITLPAADGWYIVYVMGASAVATEGQAASLTGEGIPLFEGVPNGPFRIDDATPALRVICTSSAGKVWVVKCLDM